MDNLIILDRRQFEKAMEQLKELDLEDRYTTDIENDIGKICWDLEDLAVKEVVNG